MILYKKNEKIDVFEVNIIKNVIRMTKISDTNIYSNNFIFSFSF